MLGVSGLVLVRYSLVSVRREPHPQPHLRFRRQNYYIFLNYASVIFFLPFIFLIYMRVTSYFCLYLL